MYFITFPLKNIIAKQTDMVSTFMGHRVKKKIFLQIVISPMKEGVLEQQGKI